MLVGRGEELRRITVLLDEARRGRSGTLILSGDAGLGKTALLAEARDRAPDMRVLVATGVESESELPFASLHELFRPVLHLLPRLPASQAHALAAALALEEGNPEPLAVGAGTLSLLVEAADESPVLVVLDDAHWVDHGSSEALAFAARRLIGEDIAFLLAVRPGLTTPFAPLPRLELGPLGDEDALRLLSHRAEPVAAGDEVRLLAAAAGNPLVLLELPVELARELPSTATSTERLRRTFSRRVDELSEPGRLGLLLAAAEPEMRTVQHAAETLGLHDPLAQAEVTGLVRITDGRVVFHHPVVRSLVYSDATHAARRTAHQALAAALTSEEDLDRQAWHRAAAVDGVDEEIATALEAAAGRAGARGGHAAEARALERAARLSPRKEDVARRLYAAATSANWAGDPGHAFTLAEEAFRLTEDPLLRADLLTRLSGITYWRGAPWPEKDFLEAVEAGGLDADRVATLLNLVGKMRLDRFDATGAAALAPALEQHARRAGPWWGPRALAGAANAYLLVGERGRAEELFRELASDPGAAANHSFEYLSLELYDEIRSALARSLRDGRATGNQLRIAWNQICTAHVELLYGRLSAAAAAAAEAIPLAETIGTSALVGAGAGALALVHAWRGQSEACVTQGRIAIARARETGDLYQEGVGHRALALLALGEGRPEEAIIELGPITRTWVASTVVDPFVVAFVPDLVEAYTQTGAHDQAAELLARFAQVSDRAGSTWARAASARCRAILAGTDGFDEPFDSALGLLEPSPLSLELARTRLAYGERLRRQGRRREARLHLRHAHDVFAAAHAAPWEARAAAELRATGESIGAAAEPLPELTPQELHIAALVAEGKTNKEIATALFLSPKTIGYHLANTYRKLDIHSRAELTNYVIRQLTTPPR